MNGAEVLSGAEERIRQCRTGEARLRFLDADGAPLPNLRLEAKLARHEFKLGANIFRLGIIADEALERAYQERFAALFNYATLPFYWGQYELAPGQTNEKRLRQMAAWCSEHNLAVKGHPLVWHEVFPEWAEPLDDGDVLRRQEARVREIVERFKGIVDIWDVVNEATVSERFDNAIGHWIGRAGIKSAVTEAIGWAREANPDATLVYNDFNISRAHFALVEKLAGERIIDTIGIQSHMHKGEWPLEYVWHVCERYAPLGLPLHFTELTVLSGRPKAADDDDWHFVHSDWHSTAEGEEIQLVQGRALYTTLFSHPAVEAITWWDFTDLDSWQGAPAGLVRKDMSPKPLYDWLMDAFHHRWTTKASLTTDGEGRAGHHGFFGEYEVTGTLPGGQVLCGSFGLFRRDPRDITVVLE